MITPRRRFFLVVVPTVGGGRHAPLDEAGAREGWAGMGENPGAGRRRVTLPRTYP